MPTALKRSSPVRLAVRRTGLELHKDGKVRGFNARGCRPLDPLVDELRRLAHSKRGPLPIDVDPRTRFEILCPAILSAWAAGVDQALLSGKATAKIRSPKPVPSTLKLKLTVVVADDGYFIGGAGGVLGGPANDKGPTLPCRSATSAERYDFGGLATKLREIQRVYPKERRCAVTADPAVPATDVLKTLAVIAKAFPEVTVVDFLAANRRVAGYLKQVHGSTWLNPRSRSAPPRLPPSQPSPGKVPRALVRPSLGRQAAAVIRTHRQKIRACYEQSLARDPTLQGRVVLRLKSDASGKVAKVAINADSVGDPQLVACLKQESLSWVLPQPNAEYYLPLVFAPTQP